MCYQPSGLLTFAIIYFQIPLLDRLFGVMLALVNLLVVQPDNLKEVGADEQLVFLLLLCIFCVFFVASFLLRIFVVVLSVRNSVVVPS